MCKLYKKSKSGNSLNEFKIIKASEQKKIKRVYWQYIHDIITPENRNEKLEQKFFLDLRETCKKGIVWGGTFDGG